MIIVCLEGSHGVCLARCCVAAWLPLLLHGPLVHSLLSLARRHLCVCRADRASVPSLQCSCTGGVVRRRRGVAAPLSAVCSLRDWVMFCNLPSFVAVASAACVALVLLWTVSCVWRGSGPALAVSARDAASCLCRRAFECLASARVGVAAPITYAARLLIVCRVRARCCGPAGCGKTELCRQFQRAGFWVLDEAFLDMPEYALHPQSLLMETSWVVSWFLRLLRHAAEVKSATGREPVSRDTPRPALVCMSCRVHGVCGCTWRGVHSPPMSFTPLRCRSLASTVVHSPPLSFTRADLHCRPLAVQRRVLRLERTPAGARDSRAPEGGARCGRRPGVHGVPAGTVAAPELSPCLSCRGDVLVLDAMCRWSRRRCGRAFWTG
jgi:hypothetical protein